MSSLLPGERFRVLHGDCRELLKTLEETPHACVTDPPYGIDYNPSGGAGGFAQRGHYRPVIGDTEPFDPSLLLHFPVVALFGANHYAHLLPPSSSWFVWDKRDGCGTNSFADCELIWSNLGGPARLYHHFWMGALKDSERGEARLHPTQKPVKLMRWVLEQLNLSENALVIDPYCGIGSTGVACLQLGLRFIGIEIDEQYACLATDRLQRTQQGGRQLSLAEAL